MGDAEQKLHDKLTASLEQDVDRFATARDRANTLGDLLFERAELMLSWPIAEEKRIESADDATVIIMTPTGWDQTTIAAMVKLALQCKQFALTVNKSGEASPPIQAVFDRVRDESAAKRAPEFDYPGLSQNPFGEAGEQFVDLPEGKEQ